MNGRQARKLLKNLRVLRLEKGDVLVLTLPMESPPEGALKRLQEQLKDVFDTRVIVVPKGFQFAAIREETT